MVFKEQELVQIDESFLRRLLSRDPEALLGLSIKLTDDLKEAMERLNQNPSNSSKPSSSLAPWDKGNHSDSAADDDDESIGDEKNALQPDQDNNKESSNETEKTGNEENSPESKPSTEPGKPGRQKGSKGFGRTQKIAVTDTQYHRCGCCSACGEDLGTIEKAYTGFQTLNIVFGEADAPGISLTNTQHLYYQGLCPNCDLQTRSEPQQAPADHFNWIDVGMTEWRLIGPDLAALIVYLSLDMRVTRRKVQTFLWDVLGLKISIGTLQNCMVESARALAPVEQQLIDDLSHETLIHADETSHNEAGSPLWLWVFISASTALFLIGRRTKEIFNNLFDTLAPEFNGFLMTDGYKLYRSYLKRLRCWAHLLRKAKGLEDSYSKTSRNQGKQVFDTLNELIKAVYQAREGPDEGKVSILETHQKQLKNLRQVCDLMSASPHKKTRELGRELLNDWETIFRVLEYPLWPLTNNEAERALRHWVVLRRITQGTRSDQGSRALALFASVFVTCRLRHSSPLLYIRDAIKMRRQGEDVPKLPQVLLQTTS